MTKVLYILLFLPLFAKAQIITTIAGNGYKTDTTCGGYAGDGEPATAARLGGPTGIAADKYGNIFIADECNQVIRKVDGTGNITTIAGNGIRGHSGDGGPATAARLYNPYGVAVDDTGNLFIADYYNHVIRKVNTLGIITTVAGNGTVGYSGDGAPATAAELYAPTNVTTDSYGNIFISDQGSNVIRKVNAMGIITTVVGTGVAGYAVDGAQATASAIYSPYGLKADNAGNLYFVDNGYSRVCKVSAAGIITTVAGGILIAGTYAGYSGDGGPATAAQFRHPSDMCMDAYGNLFISDFYNNVIRMVNNSGIVTTIAGNNTMGYSGDGGPATAAAIYNTLGITVDLNGDVFISDKWDNVVRKITASNLGVQEIISPELKPILYPNPVQKELTITASFPIITLSIANLIGSQVYDHEYNTNKVQVDVSGLPVGVYFVRINNTEVRRFVKE